MTEAPPSETPPAAAERAVWPHAVVVEPPVFDGPPRLLEPYEPVLVEALVSELSVERLDEAVLNRLARFDEVQVDTSLLCPHVEHLAG